MVSASYHKSKFRLIAKPCFVWNALSVVLHLQNNWYIWEEWYICGKVNTFKVSRRKKEHFLDVVNFLGLALCETAAWNNIYHSKRTLNSAISVSHNYIYHNYTILNPTWIQKCPVLIRALNPRLCRILRIVIFRPEFPTLAKESKTSLKLYSLLFVW